MLETLTGVPEASCRCCQDAGGDARRGRVELRVLSAGEPVDDRRDVAARKSSASGLLEATTTSDVAPSACGKSR